MLADEQCGEPITVDRVKDVTCVVGWDKLWTDNSCMLEVLKVE